MRAESGFSIAQLRRLFRGYVLGDRFERAAAKWFSLRGDETLRLQYPLDEESVVIDCGGFEGDWAAAINSRYGSTVFVFEPVQRFFLEIQERFKGNSRVQVFPFGLHSRDEKKSIHLSGNASSLFGDGAETETIELRNALSLLPYLQIKKIDLIKINIEGGEFDLLDCLIEGGLISSIENLQVQFHRFVPDAVARRKRIREALKVTHALSYDFEFIWESWVKKPADAWKRGP